MKITSNWLKDHLETKLNENQIIDKLTNIGLEVESVDNQPSDLGSFLVAKILKAERHPDADRLKVCDVDIGGKDSVKVVCGAPNANKDLLTIYAPPGATIPKNQMKLVVSKIRGVTSHGMLCSGSELNLSDESEGIVELLNSKYEKKNGKNYFSKMFLERPPLCLDRSETITNRKRGKLYIETVLNFFFQLKKTFGSKKI